MTIQQNTLRGIAWMLGQCAVFSVLSIITHQLSQELPVAVIYGCSILITLLMMLQCAIVTKGKHFYTTTFKFYILRAFIGTSSMLVWFYALKLTTVTEATAISFTTPLFTCIFAVLLLKEHIGPHRIIALIIGFIGAMILLHPWGNMTFNVGAFLALLTALLWSLCDVLIKYQLRSDSYNTQIFYMTLLMTLFSLPFAFLQWQTPTVTQLAGIVAIGILFFANFHALFRAYNYADLSVVMPFDFSRLIFSSIMAYFLFHEHPNGWTISGSLIIVSSTVYITYRERVAARNGKK
jgi:drug/metabolite transporter (DMT)-like permease